MWGNKKEKEYQLIITIVDQGKGEEVVECSRLGGAEGGTILTGRGAGKETAKILGILIEPEKDVVMILVEKAKVDFVLDAIVEGMELEKPGKGIAFVVDVPKVVGIANTEE